MKILGFFLMISCLPSALIDYAMPVWQTEPNTRIEDAYKWIYQATRGGEHAVSDRDAARKYLEREWETLEETAANEPLWQPLCEDESIGRVNLRPFRAGGGKIDDLLESFLKSSRDFNDSEANFLSAWNELGKRLRRKNQANLTSKEWKRLDQAMKKKNYPAIHHSQIYNEKLRPAYRILTVETKLDLLDTTKPETHPK